MLVAFRVDASLQIGTGHVMRCLTLANELVRQGHNSIFICRDHPGHLAELISSQGFRVHLLTKPDTQSPPASSEGAVCHSHWLGVTWQQDAEETQTLLAHLEADWLVVDHYALDTFWERSVATELGGIVVIDDLADRDHQCNVLIDQNLGRKASDYNNRVPDNCARLIGPQYALLRPEFAHLRDSSLVRRQGRVLKRILISLGGVDRTNVTGEVLRALNETDLRPDTELDIIMGSVAPWLEDVRQQAAQMRYRANVDVNVGDMAERMCLADLSIGAAGGTAWERCCLGLPAVLIILADNQIAGAMALEAAGAAVVIRDKDSVSIELPDLVTSMIDPKILTEMNRSAAMVTSGCGAQKVVGAMLEVGGI